MAAAEVKGAWAFSVKSVWFGGAKSRLPEFLYSHSAKGNSRKREREVRLWRLQVQRRQHHMQVAETRTLEDRTTARGSGHAMFERQRHGRAQGLFCLVCAAGSVGGPVVSGLLPAILWSGRFFHTSSTDFASKVSLDYRNRIRTFGILKVFAVVPSFHYG